MAHRKFAVVDNPSRVSCIFYVGLDGLGGLDMETEEDDHVGIHILDISQADYKSGQGIEGEFRISGTTPELDDFTIRFVDSEHIRFSMSLRY